MKRELRMTAASKVETEGRTIAGYAALFNTLSESLGGFRERIAAGAFSRALREKQDVRALVNHDPSKILGRTASGTLTLSETTRGLRFRCELPDTSYARDLIALMDRGDMTQCSFGFIARDDQFHNEADPEDASRQILVRELRDVDLLDVSVVTVPAYPDTEAWVGRSGQLLAEARKNPALASVSRLGVYRGEPLDLERERLRQRVRLALHI